MGGIIPPLSDGGVSVLQHTDNMEHNIEKAQNMKLILFLFEQLSRPKINFQKSDSSLLGKSKKRIGSETGTLPLCYLGLLMYFRKLVIKE